MRPILERALRFKEKLRRGETVHGAWLSIPDPAVAEIMAGIGFDYVIIETEHSPWDLQSLQTAVIAFNGSETVPIARVPWNDQVTIKRYLDLGIEGILAPMVRTTAEVRALVDAVRYPPVGKRGFGPRRASNYYRDIDTYMARANDALFVMPQIEHIETMDDLDAFADVPGIDALCIGPNDFSGTIGKLRQIKDPLVDGSIEKIFAAGKKRNLPVCLGINTPVERQAELVAKGCRMLLVAADTDAIVKGCLKALDEARSA